MKVVGGCEVVFIGVLEVCGGFTEVGEVDPGVGGFVGEVQGEGWVEGEV